MEVVGGGRERERGREKKMKLLILLCAYNHLSLRAGR